MKKKLPYFYREVIQSLRRNVLLNVASTSTVMILTFILGFFILMISNINNWTDKAVETLIIKVELSDDLSLEKAGKLKYRIMKHPEVKVARYVSKEAGLKKMRSRYGDKFKLDSLPGNPLPNTIEVEVKKPEKIEAVAREIRKYPGVVNTIPGERELVDVVIRVSGFVYVLGIFIIVLLLLSAIFLIGNTIRLTVFSRRKEISIMELVGASQWYIRGPFIIEGLIHGIVGSGIAVIILNLLYFWGSGWVSGNLKFLPLCPPGEVLISLSFTLPGVGIVVGATASYLSVNKYLKV